MSPGPYSEPVRRLFSRPAHATARPAGWQPTHVAEVAAPERGGWVRFEARVSAGQVGAVRFEAWGCPHFIAACELAAASLEGRPLAAAAEVTAAGLAAELEAPAEKRGRLLLVEDALRVLAAA